MTHPTDRKKKQQKILKKLTDGYSCRAAARAAGIHRQTMRAWRDEDEEFDQLCADAVEDGTDEIEDHVLAQSKRGVTIASLAALNARRPEKWRRTAKQGEEGPPPISFTLNIGAGAVHTPMALSETREGHLLTDRSKR